MNWIGFYTLVNREVGRFFSVYRQTVLPGLISSALYILIFGFTLEQRISEIDGVSYTWYILPGLIMMNTLSNATANTSSSMLQMKLLQQLPDLLTAPLSGIEISLAYIIGGTIVSLPAFVLPETSYAILFFVPFQFVYLIWAIVGTWRSASKFKPKKKQWAW